MDESEKNYVKEAQKSMDDYSLRTGLGSNEEGIENRYLWTDAFAVLNFIALKEITGNKEYAEKAEKLIYSVHYILGRYASNDPRTGWISKLSGDEARKHPTINGLRIGKKMIERQFDEPFDQRLEWERDGQYFHYHTRWINSLFKAGNYFNKTEYKKQAAELSLAGDKFIRDKGSNLMMYWKMSVDLSRPLVSTQGAHDTLEGLITAVQVKSELPKKNDEFDAYINKLEKLCKLGHWYTNDSLGLGGLLLNIVRSAELNRNTELPAEVKPEYLLKLTERGIREFAKNFKSEQLANYRLAFRECGLSLGIKVLQGCEEFLKENNIEIQLGSNEFNLANQIENFWIQEENRKTKTFQEHFNINEVSLASSILADFKPEIFARL